MPSPSGTQPWAWNLFGGDTEGTCCAQVTSSRRVRLRRLRVSHRMSGESELSERFIIVSARLKGGVSSLIHESDLGTSQGDQCGESTRLLAGKIIDLDAACFDGDEAVPDIHLITMAARQCAASEVGHSRDRPTDRPTREAQIRKRIATSGRQACLPTSSSPAPSIHSCQQSQILRLSSTGEQYYGELSIPEHIVEVFASQEPLPVIDCGNRHVSSFLKSVLCMDPSKRPAASVALDHDVLLSSGASPLEQMEMREAIQPLLSDASVLTPLHFVFRSLTERAVWRAPSTSIRMDPWPRS